MVWFLLLVLAGLVAVGAAWFFLCAVGMADVGAIPLLGPTLELSLYWDGYGGLGPRAGAAAVSALVGFVSVWLLLHALTPTPPGKLVLAADTLGLVVVSTEGICGALAQPLLQIPGVVDGRVELVATAGKPFQLKVFLDASPVADLPAVGVEARARAVDAMKRLAGIDVQAVVVEFRIVSAQRMQRALE
jgi:hypothetical protein